MCRAMPFSAHALKQILWRWYCGEKQIEMWIMVVCTLMDNEYASLLFPEHFFRRCFCLLNGSRNVYEIAHQYLICIMQSVSPSILFRAKFSLEFKAMLQKPILSCNLTARMTNKKTFKFQKGCYMLATFFATCNAHNNKRDGGNLPWAKDKFWLAHSGKIKLQVAERMLHASNLSRNVAKSRGSFYFSCNSQRNNCNCKMGCYR